MALPDVNMVHNVLHSFKITGTYHHGFVMGLVAYMFFLYYFIAKWTTGQNCGTAIFVSREML